MEKKISVITVSYNSDKTIEQTIQSVLSQGYDNLEYIIVDGASTDCTLEIVRRYADEDKRIRFVSEPDNGIYDAMNKGIRMATGDIIGILNSDDYYEPDALQNVSETIPINEKLYVIYGMIRMLKNDIESTIILNSHHFLPEKMIMHPACFISKEIYQKYLYDTKYKSAADYDYFLRLYQDNEINFFPIYKILTNFRTGGMSSGLVSLLETNRIKNKYGYISKKQKIIGDIGIRIKHLFYR